MVNLDQIIQNATQYQDIELATAVGSLSPAELQTFIQSQRDKVRQQVTAQKEGTFAKVYGDLDRASKAQSAIALYEQRTKDLATLQEQIYQHQQDGATALTDDEHMASRKQEMNEWSVQNKQDTLFVMSALFIVLSTLLLLTGLWRMDIISPLMWVGIGGPLLLIFTLIVVHRAQYTDVLRNKRYWNKQIFEGKYGRIPVPQCIGDIQGVAAAAQRTAQDAMQSVASGLATGASSAATELNAFSAAIQH
jgi:hypothetical protein